MTVIKLNTLEELALYRKKVLSELLEKDLAGVDHEKILEEWSLCADRIVAEGLKIARLQTGFEEKFCVLALGKLGSNELNFSSDIDVLYICEGEPECATRFAAKLTAILNVPFRVDTLLRPFGSQGALINTIDSLERYYEASGKEMERQTLLRARPVAGDLELGEEFIKRITPFIYRKSFDLESLKKVRALKLALEKESSKTEQDNIKLGWGGIREIEFVTHSLIILNGGKNPGLREANIFKALRALSKAKVITVGTFEELYNAYYLLRRIENILQGENDRQTHILPKNKEAFFSLAQRLGYQTAEEFLSELNSRRKSVQRHFRNLFEASYDKLEIEEAFQANLETCGTIEEIVDSIPWFKGYITKEIQNKDLEQKLSDELVSEKLTLLAETVLDRTLRLAEKKLKETYGEPTSSGERPKLAILGMGKLGSREMDYASDLDIIFIYEGNGNTSGPKVITNQEYFTKLAQSALSIISLPTRYGKAYNIDSELRPSGNQGALVTSLEAFDRYHRLEARLWERQALIRARSVAGDVTLGRKLTKLIEELVYFKELPPKDILAKEIATLRQKIIENGPGDKLIDIKKGAGGIADIEALVQFYQLVNGKDHPKVRAHSVIEAINGLTELKFLSLEDARTLQNAYIFFRRILSRVRLLSAHAKNEIDPAGELIETVANSYAFNSVSELIEKINEHQRNVMRIRVLSF